MTTKKEKNRAERLVLVQHMIALGDPATALDVFEAEGWRIYRVRQPCSGRRVARVAEPMTVEMGDKIRRLKKLQPELAIQQIAAVFNVNIGRVSEALDGKWS